MAHDASRREELERRVKQDVADLNRVRDEEIAAWDEEACWLSWYKTRNVGALAMLATGMLGILLIVLANTGVLTIEYPWGIIVWLGVLGAGLAAMLGVQATHPYGRRILCPCYYQRRATDIVYH